MIQSYFKQCIPKLMSPKESGLNQIKLLNKENQLES